MVRSTFFILFVTQETFTFPTEQFQAPKDPYWLEARTAVQATEEAAARSKPKPNKPLPTCSHMAEFPDLQLEMKA